MNNLVLKVILRLLIKMPKNSSKKNRSLLYVSMAWLNAFDLDKVKIIECG